MTGPLAEWIDRRLGFYLAAPFLAAAALTILRAAIAWQVFAISHSAPYLGLIGIVQFVPALGFALIGGAVVLYGIVTVVFGFSRSFPLSITAYAAVGVFDQVSVVLRSTTIQLATPDELRGRVSAVNLIFVGASNQLGAAESGFLAALTTATFSVVAGGLASIAVVAVVAVAFPDLVRYRFGLRRLATGTAGHP